MCRNIQDGGRRCSCDTSEARRHRRKLAKIVNIETDNNTTSQSDTPDTTKNPYENASIEECVEAAHILRSRLTIDPEAIQGDKDEYYKILEQEITYLGTRLGEIADQNTLSAEEVFKQVEKQEALHYGEISSRLEEVRERKRSLRRRYRELFEESPIGSEPFTEEQKEFLDDERLIVHDGYWKAEEEEKEILNEYQAVHQKFDKTKASIIREAYQDKREAYKNIIQQIRPVGGNLEVETDDDTRKIVNNTIGKYYPTDWVETSNQSSRKLVVVVDKEARGAYAHKPLVDDDETYDGEIEEVVGQIGSVDLTLRKGDSKEDFEEASKILSDFTKQVGLTTVIRTEPTLSRDSLTQIFNIAAPLEETYSPEKHGPLVDGKPAGEGWEYKPSLSGLESKFANVKDANDVLEAVKAITAPGWVKPKIVKLKKDQSVIRDSAESANEKSPYDPHEAVLLHEFGHRVEAEYSYVAKLEKAFLARRTGKTKENWYSDMIPALGSWNKGEIAHNAGLINPYMGRDYILDDQKPGGLIHYEVITTGLEALYGGNYGALVGFDTTNTAPKKDLDHRGFVLGALATA